MVGSLLGGISAVSLVSSGFQVGWVEPMKKILEQYFVITNNIRHITEPYVVPVFQAIAAAFEVQLSLGPNWADILLLMMVYLGSRLKAYAADGKYVRSVFMLLVSIAVCLICASFGASNDLQSWTDAFRSSAVPLLGFLAYDIVYATLGAALDRRAPVTWWNDFKRHLWFSVPLLAACASLNLLLIIFLVTSLGTSGYQAFILVFLVDYILISAYWLLRSVQSARRSENRDMGESVRERFWRSSATSVALNVAVVVVSAAAFMLSNAGLKAAGAEFSHFQK